MRRSMLSPFFAGLESPAAQILSPGGDGLHVFLVAIPEPAERPCRPDAIALHRVQVAVLPPEQAAQLDSPVALLPPLQQAVLRRGVPPLLSRHSGAGPRIVRGEILWSASGCFYEKVGRQIVPLYNLAAGPRGEVLEVPDPDALPRTRPIAPLEHDGEAWDEPAYEAEIESGAAEPAAGTPAEPAAFQPLLPGAGQRCVACFDDFREVLQAQMAHPERVRGSHRLACLAQVYEATRPQRLEAMAAALSAGSRRTLRLLPLSPELALRLGLVEALRSCAPPRRYRHRVPGVLLPGERAVRLELLQDPTATAREEPDIAVSAQPPASPEGARTATPPASGLKVSVPDAYSKPWDFKLNRDEALYELNQEACAQGVLRSFWRNLKRWLGGRSEFQRWQTLLAAKPPEEQLWTVRPPRGWMAHPSIQDWARRTLQLAGYDPASMLLEWQIYWRRKGR